MAARTPRSALGPAGRSGKPSGTPPTHERTLRPTARAPRPALRLVAYLRVSTLEQAKHGYGLDVQRAAIRDWAASHGARVVKWCVDEGKSGALLPADRPGLTDALLWLHAGRADGIISRDLDRLARGVTQQEAILAEGRGAGLHGHR